MRPIVRRTTLSAALFAAAALTAFAQGPAPQASPATAAPPPGRLRSRRARPLHQALRRLLPVRLRRMAGEEPRPRRSRALRAVRRAHRAQPDDPARHPGRRSPSRPEAVPPSTRRSATTTPPAWTRRRSRRRARPPSSRTSTASRAIKTKADLAAELARLHLAGVRGALPLRRPARLQERDACSIAARGPGRPRPARPRLLPEGRGRASRTCASSTPRTCRRCSSCWARRRRPRRRRRRPSSTSRPRWPAPRSSGSSAATPPTAYHKMKREELAALAPAFDWSAYFTAARRARVHGAQRGLAGLLQGRSSDVARRSRAWTTGRPTCAGTPCTTRPRSCPPPS